MNLLRRREKLIADVNHGIEQIDRGETVPFDPSEIKTALRIDSDPIERIPEARR